MRDVEIGVKPQLAEARARPHRRLEQLVAQQPVGRVERLGGAEQLLLAVLPLTRHRNPDLLGQRRGDNPSAPVAEARVREHNPRPGARHPRVQGLAEREPPRHLIVGRQLLAQELVGHELERGGRHPRL